MPIRLAHELSFDPQPHCPVCGTGITASGRHQPIAVDERGRPYCRLHGYKVEPEYDSLLAEYLRMRTARAQLLRDAAEHGVDPTSTEVEEVKREWQQA